MMQSSPSQPVGLLPFLGMAVAYIICLFPPFSLDNRARKAIAVETGIQNGGIANSVLILSFGDQLEIYSNAVTIPLIYNISQTVLMIVMVATYRLWLCRRKSDDHNSNIVDQKSETLTGQLTTNQKVEKRNSRSDSDESLAKTADQKV